MEYSLPQIIAACGVLGVSPPTSLNGYAGSPFCEFDPVIKRKILRVCFLTVTGHKLPVFDMAGTGCKTADRDINKHGLNRRPEIRLDKIRR